MSALFRCWCLLLLLAALPLQAGLTVERVPLKLWGWPKTGEPSRMVVLSDLHARAQDGPLMDEMVRQVVALKPSVVALLGDYYSDLPKAVPMTAEALAHHLAPLARASRVLYILGNHDQGAWAKELQTGFEKAGFTSANGVILPHSFGPGRKVEFIGFSFAFSGGRAAIERALPAKPTAVPLIALVHSPYLFQKHAFPRIDVVMAGHTHGGQICWPNGMPMKDKGGLSPELLRAGWHKTPNGTPLYITRGIGNSRVDMRLNCPPEITLFLLSGK